MAIDKRLTLEIVATLAATGTTMYLAHRVTRPTGFASLLAALAGVGLLCLLYYCGVPGAEYVLGGLVIITALAMLLRVFLET